MSHNFEIRTEIRDAQAIAGRMAGVQSLLEGLLVDRSRRAILRPK